MTGPYLQAVPTNPWCSHGSSVTPPEPDCPDPTRRPARHSPLLPSSLARCARPRVQAKIEAMGLVEVGLPFWNSRQCRVTVPAGGAVQWWLGWGVWLKQGRHRFANEGLYAQLGCPSMPCSVPSCLLAVPIVPAALSRHPFRLLPNRSLCEAPMHACMRRPRPALLLSPHAPCAASASTVRPSGVTSTEVMRPREP